MPQKQPPAKIAVSWFAETDEVDAGVSDDAFGRLMFADRSISNWILCLVAKITNG